MPDVVGLPDGVPEPEGVLDLVPDCVGLPDRVPLFVGEPEGVPDTDGVKVGDPLLVGEPVTDGEYVGVSLGDAPDDSVAVAVSLKVAVVEGELDGVGLVDLVLLLVCDFVGDTDRDVVCVPDGDGVGTGVPLSDAPADGVPELDAVGLGDGITTACTYSGDA